MSETLGVLTTAHLPPVVATGELEGPGGAVSHSGVRQTCGCPVFGRKKLSGNRSGPGPRPPGRARPHGACSLLLSYRAWPRSLLVL